MTLSLPAFLQPLSATRCGLILLLLSVATRSQAQSGTVTLTQSFSYTGQIVTFTVPTGVRSLTIEARGAEGGASVNQTAAPGKGAIVAALVSVTSGQSLSILVGQDLSGKFAGGGAVRLSWALPAALPRPLRW